METYAQERGVLGGAVQGGTWLSAAAAEQLRAALEQMDLLLAAQQLEAGSRHLVELLRKLRDLRVEMAR